MQEVIPLFQICGSNSEVNVDYWPKEAIVPENVIDKFLKLGYDQYLYVSAFKIDENHTMVMDYVLSKKHKRSHEDIFNNMRIQAGRRLNE
jgi:hypothetical protein